MEKINRFLAKHNIAIYATSCVLWTALYCLLVRKAGIGLFVFAMVMIYLSAAWLNTRHAVLLKKPMEILDTQCDPYPYLEELQRQKTYSSPWTLRYNITLFEVFALSAIGQMEQAYQLLITLQERIFRSRYKLLQINFCTSMVALCRNLGRSYDMENWHTKFMDIFQKMKPNRQKQRLTEKMPLYLAQYHCYRQEHDRSLELLAQCTAKTLYEQVIVTMAYARNYVALDEKEKAKEALYFVAEKGNRLYIAQQARQMLAQLEEMTDA